MVALSGVFLLSENVKPFLLGLQAKGHSHVLPHLLLNSEHRPDEGKGMFAKADPIPGSKQKTKSSQEGLRGRWN